jgi:phage terminase large subunit-like protein
MAQALGITKGEYDILVRAGWRPAEIAQAMPQELADALKTLRDTRERIFQGQEAYVAGLARIENPYRPGTRRYLAWAEGWDAAYTADRRDP